MESCYLPLISPICSLYMNGNLSLASHCLWDIGLHSLHVIPSCTSLPHALLPTVYLEDWRSTGEPSWDLGTLASLVLCVTIEQSFHLLHNSSSPFCLWGNCRGPSTLQCPCPFQLPCRRKGTAILLAPSQPGAILWLGSPSQCLWLQGLPPVLPLCRWLPLNSLWGRGS